MPVTLTLKLPRCKPRTITVTDDALEMLSEATRKTVMDESADDSQRFKVLVEELYRARRLSTYKVAEKLNIKC